MATLMLQGMGEWYTQCPNLEDDLPHQAVILISTGIDTNQWEQVHIPHTHDLVSCPTVWRVQ